MKVIHLSDLHFPTPLPFFSLKGKMFTGYINFYFRRRKKYPLQLLNSLIQSVKNSAYDLLIISGDLTNVSHEYEFQKAREILDPLLDERTFIIPGNHDRYIHSAIYPTDLFEKYFSEYMGEKIGSSTYIYLKKINNYHILGWDSNYPSGIGIASGRIDSKVIDETIQYLKNRSIHEYFLVCHHPLWNPYGYEETKYHRMVNREEVIQKLNEYPPSFYFHGHKHSNFYKKADNKIKFNIINSASSTMKSYESHYCGYHTLDISSEKLIVKRKAYNDVEFVDTELLEY